MLANGAMPSLYPLSSLRLDMRHGASDLPGVKREEPIMTKLFDNAWLARTDHGNGWASQVIESLDTTGGIYLSTLRSWFNQFALRKNDKHDVVFRGLSMTARLRDEA